MENYSLLLGIHIICPWARFQIYLFSDGKITSKHISQHKLASKLSCILDRHPNGTNSIEHQHSYRYLKPWFTWTTSQKLSLCLNCWATNKRRIYLNFRRTFSTFLQWGYSPIIDFPISKSSSCWGTPTIARNDHWSSFKRSSCWAMHNLSIKTMTGRRRMQRRSRCQKPVVVKKTSGTSLEVTEMSNLANKKWAIYKMMMILWVIDCFGF